MHDPRLKRTVRRGQRVWVEMPYSEVCMHMKVAGHIYECELFSNGPSAIPMVKMYWDSARRNPDNYSTVTPGEAGFYWDEADGWYTYIVAESVPYVVAQ